MKDEGVYSLYGLRVSSAIGLPAPRAQSEAPPYDLRFEWGEPGRVADSPPSGAVLAGLETGGGRVYALTETENGYLMSISQIGQFEIASDLQSVRVHSRPNVPSELIALFLIGNVIACVLTLTGEPVLHASAVQIGDSALAFLGESGMGKSTLAALLCADGARLITDDLLRLLPDGLDFRCFAGTRQLRLRPGAALVAENFPACRRGTTADHRIAVTMDENQSMPGLAAIVIPRLSRERKALKVRRLQRSASLFHLMAFPRLAGLQQKHHLQRQLDFFGHIAARIPIFEAAIPWGQPTPRGLASALAHLIWGQSRC